MKPKNFKELKEKMLSLMTTKFKTLCGKEDLLFLSGYEEAMTDIEKVFKWVGNSK